MEQPATSRRVHWIDQDVLAFDLETTGVDPHRDVPVAYALVGARGGRILSCDSSIVDPGCDVPPAATAVHGITTERARSEGVPLREAVVDIAARVLDASRRGIPILGMKVDYDLTMLDACYLRETGFRLSDEGFRGPVVDVLVLDRHFDRFRRGRRTLAHLCREYGASIERPHDAAADAVAAISVAVEMCGRFAGLRSALPESLHRLQVDWHRDWVDSFSEWRQRQGLARLQESERCWPIAPALAI